MTKLNILALLAASNSIALASNVWTINCAPLTVQRSDPIKNPGEASGHVHAVVGSTAFSRNMNDANAAQSGAETTCDKYSDHSNYWAPHLYHMQDDGKFAMMQFTGMVAYYQNYTCDYDANAKGCPPNGRKFSAFPEGLRMIAGNSERRTYNASSQWDQAILMESGNDGEKPGMPQVLHDKISGHVRFPSCWDGVNLDSADHQSHVNYPDPTLGGDTQGGMCPKSHPHAMPNIGAEFGWNLPAGVKPGSLVFSQGDTTGYGLHGDFLMGWKDPQALHDSFSNCFTNDNCPWRQFMSPTGKDWNPIARLPAIPGPFENIGWLGPLDSLPGNNPVHRRMAIKGRQVDAAA